MSSIQDYEVIEGNLKAEKDTGDFGGGNMWRLYIRSNQGRWESVQWMNVHSIQRFFSRQLPVYQEIGSTKYKLQSI
jgi:hypothetical protein